MRVLIQCPGGRKKGEWTLKESPIHLQQQLSGEPGMGWIGQQRTRPGARDDPMMFQVPDPGHEIVSQPAHTHPEGVLGHPGSALMPGLRPFQPGTQILDQRLALLLSGGFFAAVASCDPRPHFNASSGSGRASPDSGAPVRADPERRKIAVLAALRANA